MFLIKTPLITDPKTNLAIEEFAVRNLDISKEYLFVYSNAPSVIIGKNQNPFEEVNISFIQENKIELVRRISGGGAVYHESGNINFCFISKNTKDNFNNYANFLNPVVLLLKKYGVVAEINNRNDLIISGKKISGNAQFTSRNRLLSHGTLLFNANLQNVSEALSATNENIQSKSTKSARSRVTNISEYLTEPISVIDFKEDLENIILKSFSFEGYVEFDQIQTSEINDLAERKFNTWQWNWGRTPVFKVMVEDQSLKFKATLTIKSGNILEIEYLKCSTEIKSVLDGLLNIRYSKEDIQNHVITNSKQLIAEEKQKLINSIFPY